MRTALYIDSNPNNYELILRIIRNIGDCHAIAHNSKEALVFINDRKFDYFVINLFLSLSEEEEPDFGNGIMMIEQIRDLQPLYFEYPIIVFNNCNINKELIHHCMEAGANHFFVFKPNVIKHRDELKRNINRLITRALYRKNPSIESVQYYNPNEIREEPTIKTTSHQSHDGQSISDDSRTQRHIKDPVLSDVIEEEIKRLSNGKILFNPPGKMQVGEEERVEVRITKTFNKDLKKGLKGRGIPQIEEIKVATFMKVRLKGENFAIRQIGGEDQFVSDGEFTQWQWDVLPLKAGKQTLLLEVAVRIKIPNSDEEAKFTVFEREITVYTNYSWSVKKIVKENWEKALDKI